MKPAHVWWTAVTFNIAAVTTTLVAIAGNVDRCRWFGLLVNGFCLALHVLCAGALTWARPWRKRL